MSLISFFVNFFFRFHLWWSKSSNSNSGQDSENANELNIEKKKPINKTTKTQKSGKKNFNRKCKKIMQMKNEEQGSEKEIVVEKMYEKVKRVEEETRIIKKGRRGFNSLERIGESKRKNKGKGKRRGNRRRGQKNELQVTSDLFEESVQRRMVVEPRIETDNFTTFFHTQQELNLPETNYFEEMRERLLLLGVYKPTPQFNVDAGFTIQDLLGTFMDYRSNVDFASTSSNINQMTIWESSEESIWRSPFTFESNRNLCQESESTKKEDDTTVSTLSNVQYYTPEVLDTESNPIVISTEELIKQSLLVHNDKKNKKKRKKEMQKARKIKSSETDHVSDLHSEELTW